MHGLPVFDLLAASIRKFGLEIKNRCTDCPCFDLFAASIRKSRLEIENRCTDCPCFDLMAASILKSGLEIKNRCTDCPCFDLLAESIRKSGLEIENRCSAIVPASRTVRLQQSLLRTRTVPPAAPSYRQVEWPACSSRSRNDAVSDSNFRCLKEE